MAGVAGHPQQGRQRPVAEPDVQDSVEHPRHGHRRPGPHRHQQRSPVAPEGQSRRLLDLTNAPAERSRRILRQFLAVLEVGPAEGRRQHEAGRHGQPGLGHADQVRRLVADHLRRRVARARGLAAEEIHVPGFALRRHGSPRRYRRRTSTKMYTSRGAE